MGKVLTNSVITEFNYWPIHDLRRYIAILQVARQVECKQCKSWQHTDHECVDLQSSTGLAWPALGLDRMHASVCYTS